MKTDTAVSSGLEVNSELGTKKKTKKGGGTLDTLNARIAENTNQQRSETDLFDNSSKPKGWQ